MSRLGHSPTMWLMGWRRAARSLSGLLVFGPTPSHVSCFRSAESCCGVASLGKPMLDAQSFVCGLKLLCFLLHAFLLCFHCVGWWRSFAVPLLKLARLPHMRF